MIRFTARAAQGQVLGMGLSHANLALLAEGRPIRFDLAPYGDSGHLLLLAGSEGDVAAAIASGDHVLGLTPRTLDSLKSGNVIPVELAGIGLTALWQAILFAGPSERQIVDDVRAAGLIPPEAKLDWDEYERHERCADPGCPECVARWAVPAAEQALQQVNVMLGLTDRPPWKRWLALLAILVVVAVVLGLLLAPSAAPR